MKTNSPENKNPGNLFFIRLCFYPLCLGLIFLFFGYCCICDVTGLLYCSNIPLISFIFSSSSRNIGLYSKAVFPFTLIYGSAPSSNKVLTI